MTVQELEDLLALLPADMQVHIETRGRIGAYHVTMADKRSRTRAEKITFHDDERCPKTWRGKRSVLVAGDGSYVIPGSLVLRGDGAAWFDDEPDFTVRGRWPKPKPSDLSGEKP